MILSYGILCSMLCPPYYAMSDFGAARLTNTVWLIFLALALFNYVYLLGWLDCKPKFFTRKISSSKLSNPATSPWWGFFV